MIPRFVGVGRRKAEVKIAQGQTALQPIAMAQGRSVAQICEAFLKAGSESYKKQGNKFLQRFLVQPRAKLKVPQVSCFAGAAKTKNYKTN